MKKRRTSKTRRRNTAKVLEARVISPRIVWFKILRFFVGTAKLAFVLASLTAIGWGVWQGIQKAFYQNPDFTLQSIDLNPNPVIDEVGLAEITELDLTANLFEIDTNAIVKKLQSLPAVTHATAERHLPGTLAIRVSTRIPRAWITNPDAGIRASRSTGDLLIDQSGVLYPCPELQLESAARLPVIVLSENESHPLKIGKALSHPELKPCLHLLESCTRENEEAAHWIDSIRQVNAWSLLLTTREGVSATFSLRDHPRQIRQLRAALDHAGREGYSIATINLIPKENIPITLRSEAAPPRAIPVREPSPEELREERRLRDLNTLLNRD